ncbi:MAG: restriction endonuclease subunit S [Methylomonas sp.]|jgi:type I restriction enzyme S subunit|uniref:restriction endonuclease subunit S n=1 Tax=Methylomonas sp. TaxID=418 RepID=UPI0025ED995D|nr:restriction endonuclease subunit S [Methylomonas sp.]MCK9605902.1 restriction endonuclease subunit S [Methylomonas sp.]
MGGIKNGYSPNPSEKLTGYWVLGLGALGDDGLNIDGIKPVEPSPKTLDSSIKWGDFLVSRSNTPDKVGRSIRFKGEIANCSYPDLMMRFRINERIADADFIEAFLKSSLVRGYYKSCAAGSSSTMVKINKSIVENTPLVLPPITEQQKIAETLATWDQAIATAEKLLVNSQQQKNALIQQLLSGKKRIPGFNDPWAKYKFIDIIYEIKKDVVNNPKDYELLSVKLHCKGVVKTGKYPAVTESSRPYFIRHEGELIIGRQNLHNGGIGIVPKVVGGCIASNAISSFDVHENVSKSFMLHIMSRPLFFTQIDNLIGGTGQKEISVNELLKLKIKIPSFEEQQRIARILTTSDREIETLQQKLACLKQEKKALMQQLLTGKRRVKVDES